MLRTKILKLRINIHSIIIRPQNLDLRGILIFNQILKVFKHIKQLTLLFKEKEPSKSSKIINEHNIVIVSKQRSNRCWALNIKMNNL